MKNVFWDIKVQYRRHITSLQQSPTGYCYVRYDVFTAVTMKNAVLWDVTPCGVLRLLVSANVVPTSPILVTLMMEAICSSESSVLTRATRRHIPEDGIHQIHFEFMKENV
jgi:hypothetical protein